LSNFSAGGARVDVLVVPLRTLVRLFLNRTSYQTQITKRIKEKIKMQQIITLREMKVGERAIIKEVKAKGELGRRILDMGLVPETEIKVVGRAPLRDPVALRLKGFTLTLRNSEADWITVASLSQKAS
jgi:ferrous iron transport protein A